MLLILLYALLKHSLRLCITLAIDLIRCTLITTTTHRPAFWVRAWVQLVAATWTQTCILAFQRCGVVVKKLGQLTSNEAWVPHSVRCILKHLNNHASEPIDNVHMRRHLEQCYAKSNLSMTKRFASVDWSQPVGTGCIAQTHRAVVCTDNGPRAALVKIFKPHVAMQTKDELAMVDPWVKRMLSVIPEMDRRYCLGFRWQHFQHSLLQQTDSVVEMENHRNMWREVHESNSPMMNNVRVPRLFEDHCVPGVVVMEWMEDAFPLTSLPGLCQQHGADWLRVRDLTTQRLRLFCMYTMFQSRYHHGDPHPGNFLLQLGDSEDTPVLLIPIDFGVVHVKSDARRVSMQRICEHLLQLDLLACVVEVYRMVVLDEDTMRLRPACDSPPVYRTRLWTAMHALFCDIVRALNAAPQPNGTTRFDAEACSTSIRAFLGQYRIVMNEEFVDLDVTILALNNTVRELDGTSNLFVELWSTLTACHRRMRISSNPPPSDHAEIERTCRLHHMRLYPGDA